MKTKPMYNQKNFKKKNSNLTIQIPKEKQMQSSDRFSQLKNKLEKQKQMMKKTGRRFKDQNSINIQTEPLIKKTHETKHNKDTQKCQIMIGTDEKIVQSRVKVQKDVVNLNEIKITQNQPSIMMSTSRVFEKQIKSQKKRSGEVYEFLKKISLQNFYQGLINAGFDDLDSLSGVTTEDLNHLHMRGRQQDKLFFSLKQNNLLQDDDKLQTKSSRPSTSSTQWRIKTESSLQNSQVNEKSSSRMKTMSAFDILEQAKKSGTSEKPTSFMGNSFLYMVGSKNWSLEDQVRKACSNCFRISTQMKKKGDCFYCQSCYEAVSNDLLNISIGSTMNRSYQKNG